MTMTRLAILACLFGLAVTSAARAADLDQRYWMRPLYEPEKITLSGDEALIVVGYSIRGAEKTSYGTQFPVHFGWMPFDAAGNRLGQTMMTSTERCARGVSKACESVQYRLYKIPAGNYALAWTFHGKLIGLADFKEGGVRFHRQTQEIQAINLSDNAHVRLGLPGFRVAAGEVLYIGDLVLTFRDRQPEDFAWSPTRDEANVRSIMAASPYADRFTVRQGGYLGGQKRP
jgi:hypothetical protein